MSPQWEVREGAPALDLPLYMDAELKPNCSLSRGGFSMLMGVMIAVNAALAYGFFLQGLFLVGGFLGLDMALLYLAFRANYRDGKAVERVCVAAHCLHVMQQSARGRRVHWVVNPIWARVETGDAGVLVIAGGRMLRLARFLSPDEREAFAIALRKALRRAHQPVIS